VVGVCSGLAAIVVLVLLLTDGRGGVARSPEAKHLAVQKRVAALFAGIPQHGVILGKSSAPVTLQVFVDLEDHGDGTSWFDVMLPPILKRFVRTNIVRLEFHSFKTDTLNGGPFITQQTASLAAGAQNRLWNYVATFMNEQGTEFTNYATEAFVIGIAKQVAGLHIAEWEKSRTLSAEKLVMADNYNARYRLGFHATPAFRIGLTGGQMKHLAGLMLVNAHKYIVQKKPSGERYLVGESGEWQRPISLVDVDHLKKAVEALICPQRDGSCPSLASRRH
jgi:protein-disulfide isomerase